MKESKYMARAIELASLGTGSVSPNPLVGCVIVHNDSIIGEGWHGMYGGPHAEVSALSNVIDRAKLKASDVYVSLEPCSHHGKTPPCADLLIDVGVRRVFVATLDPNPLVAGKGVKKLSENGIEVNTGLLEKEARFLNRRFFSMHEKNRPYVILKWAQTADGFMARSNYDSKWISSEISRKLVHKWRAEEDALLVGFNTAKYDDPHLGVRNWSGNDPTRIVVDPHLALSKKLKIFDGSIPTIIYHRENQAESGGTEYVKLGSGHFWDELLADVARRALSSIIVEGGRNTLLELIETNNWDEAKVFVSTETFKEGIAAPKLPGDFSKEAVGPDTLLTYLNK